MEPRRKQIEWACQEIPTQTCPPCVPPSLAGLSPSFQQLHLHPRRQRVIHPASPAPYPPLSPWARPTPLDLSAKMAPPTPTTARRTVGPDAAQDSGPRPLGNSPPNPPSAFSSVWGVRKSLGPPLRARWSWRTPQRSQGRRTIQVQRHGDCGAGPSGVSAGEGAPSAKARVPGGGGARAPLGSLSRTPAPTPQYWAFVRGICIGSSSLRAPSPQTQGQPQPPARAPCSVTYPEDPAPWPGPRRRGPTRSARSRRILPTQRAVPCVVALRAAPRSVAVVSSHPR